jgi:hypothetical protein
MNNTDNRIYPVRNQVYSLAEITKLYLRDSACFSFYHNDVLVVIQNTNVLNEELCANADFAAMQWKFIRETDEWIPIFHYAGERPITDFVTIEEGAACRRQSEYWVCWKGFHEPQLTEFEEHAAAFHFGEDWIAAHEEQAVRKALEAAIATPPIIETYPPAEDISFQKVMESLTKPMVIPRYSSEELASDPVKAEHYLASRTKDVGAFDEKTPLVWEKVNMAQQKAKLYEAGYIEQHAGWSHWGNFRANPVEGKRPQDAVRFKTRECFVAWTLQLVWKTSRVYWHGPQWSL